MLPQGNAQPINEEQNGKNESPPPNIGTPKRNPAIAAIDRLLIYSPLPSGAVQKLDETSEKIVSWWIASLIVNDLHKACEASY